VDRSAHPGDDPIPTVRPGVTAASRQISLGSPAQARIADAVRRRLRSALSSYRLRLLGWFVVLLAVGTVATVAVVGQLLLAGTDERIRQDLIQESEEFRSLASGMDPVSGEPFGEDVRRIFDVFLDRNVPAHNEAILTFVDGELFRRSAARSNYQLGQDPDFIGQVARVVEPTPGRHPSPVGAVDYLAVPVIFDGETRGVFVVAIFRDLERAEQDDVLRAVATVGIVLLVIGSLLAWRLADRVLAPVRRTAATARSISETDLSQRVDVNGHDEVAELAQTFNEMLDRVSGAFDEQRRFMDDAGHELRTPLTIAQGHLELIDEGTHEDRRHTLELVLDELSRMTRLVNDLVLLAAASRPDFVRRSTIEAGDLVRGIYEKVRVLGDRGWRLEIEREGPLHADRQRLTQAVLQLAQNAVQHTEPGEVIALGLNVDEVEASLWVRDSGRGIAELEQEAIFRRFYRADGDKRASGSGTGLGLSIVRAIAEAHGGSVALVSRPGAGATFTIVIQRDSAKWVPHDRESEPNL
jgi:signal transduction histidine kinase